MLFSNESSVQQFSVRVQHVSRPSGERYHEKYTVLTVKHPPSQMVWGAMSAAANSGFYFLTPRTTMNGEKYVKVLQEKLQLHMTVHQCEIFMRDGVPCHRSRVVKKFLGEKNIRQLDWPGNSPDLNPIENLWMLLENKVSEKQPTNAKSLVTAIKEVWTKEISVEYCKKLIVSMPQRIEAVLRSCGGHTKN